MHIRTCKNTDVTHFPAHLTPSLIGSKPILAIASKWRFYCIAFALSVFEVYRAVVAAQIMAQVGVIPGGLIRVNSSGSAGANSSEGRSQMPPSNPQAPQLASIGLLKDGCKVLASDPAPFLDLSSSAASVTVKYPPNGTYNGYFFATSGAVGGLLWSVESSVDNGSSWTVVGASVWRLDPQNTAGNLEFYPQLPYEPPRGPTAGVSVDYRPGWPWVVAAVVDNAVNAVGIFCFILVGVAGYGRYCKYVLASLFAFAICEDSAAWIHYFSADQLRMGLSSLLIIPENSILATGLLLEIHLPEVFVLYGLVGIVARCMIDFVVYRAEAVQFIINNVTSACFVGFLLAVGLMLWRSWDVRRSIAMVRPDKTNYDRLWQAIVEGEELRAHADGMRAAIDKALQSNPAAAGAAEGPRQHFKSERQSHRLAKKCGLLTQTWRRSSRDAEDTIEMPVWCLGQLFFQAECMYTIFLWKIKEWALLSRGCFPVVQENGTKMFLRHSFKRIICGPEWPPITLS